MILTDTAGVMPAKGKSVMILSPGFLRDLSGHFASFAVKSF
jgi:hypothetical protein